MYICICVCVCVFVCVCVCVCVCIHTYTADTSTPDPTSTKTSTRSFVLKNGLYITFVLPLPYIDALLFQLARDDNDSRLPGAARDSEVLCSSTSSSELSKFKKKKVVKARDDFDSRLPGAAHDSEEEGEGGGGEGKQ
jgi:hypothetical protein